MSFLTHFNNLEDGRTDINIAHNLLDVVFLTVVAVISGAEGWLDIQRFGDAKLTWLRRHRPFEAGIPRRHTVARIISALEPDRLLACFLDWVNEAREKQGQEHIAIDGKTLRRSHDGEQRRALHLLSAMVVDSGLVIAQRPCDGKANELTTVSGLLDLLNIEGSCVSLDAMHCQTQTVAKLRQKKADYVIQVKANQKGLYQEIQAYFHKVRRDNPDEAARGVYHDVDKGHGRLEQRRYTRLDVSDWLENRKAWSDLASLVEVVRTVESGGQMREETSYYISSLGAGTPALADKIRRHWQIENGQHWILDVVFREDDSRVRTGDGPCNMALFRRFALNLAKCSPSKDSMKGKLKRAAWDDEFRSKLLFG